MLARFGEITVLPVRAAVACLKMALRFRRVSQAGRRRVRTQKGRPFAIFCSVLSRTRGAFFIRGRMGAQAGFRFNRDDARVIGPNDLRRRGALQSQCRLQHRESRESSSPKKSPDQSMMIIDHRTVDAESLTCPHVWSIEMKMTLARNWSAGCRTKKRHGESGDPRQRESHFDATMARHGMTPEA